MKFVRWKIDLIVLLFCATAFVKAQQPEVNLPLVSGQAGIEGLKLVSLAGVRAKLERVTKADKDKEAIKISFSKSGEERRLLALEALPKGNLSGTKALALKYRLKLVRGQPPRIALLVFEKGGGMWFKVGNKLIATNEFTDSRLAITRLKPAEFRLDADGQLDHRKIEKVWLGFVLDGITQGTLEISQAKFTSEPYRASQLLKVTGDGSGVWSLLAKDPAVQARLSMPNEGPGGKPCMKFEFTFPGQLHMYALPSTPVPDVDLEGYHSLRFTYKATLPAGITGLLIMLMEHDGSQYEARPYPQAQADWTTITIPFEAFQLGGWSRDENKQLDLDQISTIIIGVHGTASGTAGSGTIWTTNVEFVP